MKKSHKKILIFQIVLFLIFVLNSFVSNILREYNFIIFLIISLIMFKRFFGFERDRNRYSKSVMADAIIFLFTFFILYYLFGIIIGFAKTNYYNWYSFEKFIIPLILTIILKEILRYMMLKKIEGNKLLQITTIILFAFLDITESIYYSSFTSNYTTFIFVALSLLPSISTNIACNYISNNAGYKPVILYLLMTRLYAYLLPIVPNANEYITAIITLLLPLAFMRKVYVFMQKEKDEYIKREYNKKNITGILFVSLLTAIIVYFTSGYFKYYALAVASGSMNPKIKKGDVVIVKKLYEKYDTLKTGEILVYKYDDVVVVHRIVNIIKQNNEYYFYTKGDANGNVDNYVITEEMVIGTTNLKIPYIGMPTVWLNEL